MWASEAIVQLTVAVLWLYEREFQLSEMDIYILYIYVFFFPRDAIHTFSVPWNIVGLSFLEARNYLLFTIVFLYYYFFCYYYFYYFFISYNPTCLGNWYSKLSRERVKAIGSTRGAKKKKKCSHFHFFFFFFDRRKRCKMIKKISPETNDQ